MNWNLKALQGESDYKTVTKKMELKTGKMMNSRSWLKN